MDLDSRWFFLQDIKMSRKLALARPKIQLPDITGKVRPRGGVLSHSLRRFGTPLSCCDSGAWLLRLSHVSPCVRASPRAGCRGVGVRRILLSAFVPVHWRGARRMLAMVLATAARAAWARARAFHPSVSRSFWRTRAPYDSYPPPAAPSLSFATPPRLDKLFFLGL